MATNSTFSWSVRRPPYDNPEILFERGTLAEAMAYIAENELEFLIMVIAHDDDLLKIFYVS